VRPRDATADQPAGGPECKRLTLVLRPHRDAPRAARRALRRLCSGTSVPPSVVDDAALVTSELITTCACQAHGGTISVTFETGEHEVRVCVQDTVTDAAVGPNPLWSSTRNPLRSWDVVRRIARACGAVTTGSGREIWAAVG
jgi:hypothetical protein